MAEIDRPHKQHRRIMNGNPPAAAADNTPDSRFIDDDHMLVDEPDMLQDGIADALLPADTAEWQATVERVIPNVVSIRFCQTCSFDTDPALTSEATGFVVDAERGYVAFGIPLWARGRRVPKSFLQAANLHPG